MSTRDEEKQKTHTKHTILHTNAETKRHPSPLTNMKPRKCIHDTKEAVHTRKIVRWAQFACIISIGSWLVLVSIIFYLAGIPPSEITASSNPNYTRVSETSKTVANAAAMFQVCAILLRTIHHLNSSSSKWMVRFGSSPYHLTVVIMLISALTNFQLANFPTPTYRDMISGMTVYPIRWAEWTILGGSLTFMTESLDAKYYTMPLLMAATQTAR